MKRGAVAEGMNWSFRPHDEGFNDKVRIRKSKGTSLVDENVIHLVQQIPAVVHL